MKPTCHGHFITSYQRHATSNIALEWGLQYNLYKHTFVMYFGTK